jgi:hypothetical protein
MRSAKVDLPWSMWAIMQKFRMKSGLVFAGSSLFLARGDKFTSCDVRNGCEGNPYILAQMVAPVP